MIHEENGDLRVTRGKKSLLLQSRGNPLERFRELMEEYRPVTVPGLPRFVGGAVGYFSYDMVRTFEELPCCAGRAVGMPDFAFLLTDTMLIFDNVSQKIKVVANAHVIDEGAGHTAAYRHATERIESMITRLKRPLRQPRHKRRRKPMTFTANMSKADFEKMVVRTKEYIRAGDIVQAVLSQRWETNVHATPLQLYRALRVVNPSPYMYYLRLAGVELVGSSPETLVRCENGLISFRPIAGTRRRGVTPEEDQQMERRLLADEKERAEHVMLSILGGMMSAAWRNQVRSWSTRSCTSNGIPMSCTSCRHVTGQLDTVEDLVRRVAGLFPCRHRVSGAPKIRAMQIIDELEPHARGPYAGAVGYFSFSGNMDHVH